MKKGLLWLFAIPLIVIGSLTYANDFIVHDSTGWTITIYTWDFSYGITIQDKNLWAENIGDIWSYFQWWNNNGNPWDSAISTDLLVWNSGYDNKWYNWTNNWFIKFWNWSSSNYDIWLDNQSYDNLWWGGNDNDTNQNILKWYDTSGHVATNLSWRQWPCDSGYHVPSAWEWHELMMLRCRANSDICKNEYITWSKWEWGNEIYNNNDWNHVGAYFLNDIILPRAGYRTYRTDSENTIVWGTGDYAYYWSSSARDNYAWSFQASKHKIDPSDGSYRSQGLSVRCFKDSYVTPDLYTISFNPEWWEDLSWMVVLSWKSIKLQWAIREGYSFSWWYLESWDFVWISWDVYTPTESTTLHAHWTPIEYTITYLWIRGDYTPSATTYTIESGAITLVEPTRDGYKFLWWSGTDIDWITWTVTIPAWSRWNRTYEANREIIEYTITYELDGWINSEDNIWEYTVETYIAFEDATKTWYNFDGWYSDTGFVDKITEILMWNTWDITLYAKWTENKKPSWGSSSGGWGGRSNKTSDTQDSSATPQNDNKSLSWTEVKNPRWDTQDSSDNASEWQNQQQFTQEFQNAYEFAKQHWITTMPTIEEANMEGPLTRIAMAKMLSYYAINVLWQKPDETRINKFNDIPEELDKEYDNGVTLAYQLWIMWINMPDNNFRPDDEVTRAEFTTALSRLLYKIADGEDLYYSTHIQKLMEEKIITNNDPNMKELRGYVMIMLMRSAK